MKSKFWTLCIPVLAMFLLAGCKKDEEGALRVVFTGSFAADPLVMFETVGYINGQRLQFSRSEFFISDLNLIDGSGNAYPLSEIELIDLSFTTASAAEGGVVLTFDKIPAGTYSDLEFGFGVASDINATKPSDYLSSSPLSSAGRYWTPWTSYIFSKTEGNMDTLVDGVDNPDLGFAYHSGTDDLYQELRINTPISISDGGSARITFNLDHQKLLGIPGAPLDIQANPQNHNPGDLEYVQAILNNVVASLTFILE